MLINEHCELLLISIFMNVSSELRSLHLRVTHTSYMKHTTGIEFCRSPSLPSLGISSLDFLFGNLIDVMCHFFFGEKMYNRENFNVLFFSSFQRLVSFAYPSFLAPKDLPINHFMIPTFLWSLHIFVTRPYTLTIHFCTPVWLYLLLFYPVWFFLKPRHQSTIRFEWMKP